MAEDKVHAALAMDRAEPIGNSLGPDGRRALHAKVTESVLPDGAATEAKQDEQITEIITVQDLLVEIRDYTDQVETLLQAVENNTDGLESLSADIAVSADNIDDKVSTEAKQDAQITQLDEIKALLNILRAKNNVDGMPVEILADHLGRLMISPEAVGDKLDLVKTQSLAANAINYFEYTVPALKTLQLAKFYCGGIGSGTGTIAKHTASATQFVANGDFESAGDVTAWAVGTGTFTAPSPDVSTVQKVTGASSMRWIYVNSATALRRNKTFSPAYDFTTYRYLSAKFFNDAAVGTTRTVSIILSSAGATSTYSLAGTLGTAPFTASTWVSMLFELTSPTSVTGGGADLTAVTSISLVMQDGANRTGTVYWDTVQQEDLVEILHKVYFAANSTAPIIDISPSTDLMAGDTLYLITRSTNNTKAEYTIVAKGVLI